MPRTYEQFQEIRDLRKRAIMEAALEVFAGDGYHAASVSKIAKNAKISKGLMYNYFKSKEQLLKELLLSGMSEVMSLFTQNQESGLTEEELKIFITNSFRLFKENINFWRLYFSVLLQNEVLKLIFKEFMEMLMPFFKTLTDYYERKGVEKPLAHAYLLASTLDGVGMSYINDPDNYPIDDIEQIIIEKFC